MFRKKKDDEEPKDPFDAFFGDFSRIEDTMREIMNNMLKDFNDVDPESSPFVSGFSMRTGPDGKPVIRRFGNVKKPEGEKLINEIEPLVDVMECGGEVVVIVELPGARKDEINLECSGDELEITVSNEKKPYHKIVKLPVEVKKDKIDASYNNGVLEIKIERKKKVKKGKNKINIR
jgi:HSP20 family protein